MTTSTDAEAIARLVAPDIWIAYDDYVVGTRDDPAIPEPDRTNALENAKSFVRGSLKQADAILSYLASRQGVQEPVAWQQKLSGRWHNLPEDWTKEECERQPEGKEFRPLYTAPPSGEVERLRRALEAARRYVAYRAAHQAYGTRSEETRLVAQIDAALNGGRE